MHTKEQIIETANNLFLKNGIKTITLERIAKELHTSKRTIYTHFTDKTDLLRDCLQLYYEQASEENQRLIEKATNPIEAMGLIYFHIVKRSISTNPNYFQDILHYYPGVLREAYRQKGHFAHSNILYLAQWGIREGIFLADMDIEVTTKTVLALLDLTKDQDRFPATEFTKKRLTFGIMLPYLRGVCTEKGIQILEKQRDLFEVAL